MKDIRIPGIERLSVDQKLRLAAGLIHEVALALDGRNADGTVRVIYVHPREAGIACRLSAMPARLRKHATELAE